MQIQAAADSSSGLAGGQVPPDMPIIKRGRGARVITIDGSILHDFWLANGRYPFGHAPAFLTQAQKNAVSRGDLHSYPQNEHLRLLNRLAKILPGYRFCFAGADVKIPEGADVLDLRQTAFCTSPEILSLGIPPEAARKAGVGEVDGREASWEITHCNNAQEEPGRDGIKPDANPNGANANPGRDGIKPDANPNGANANPGRDDIKPVGGAARPEREITYSNIFDICANGKASRPDIVLINGALFLGIAAIREDSPIAAEYEASAAAQGAETAPHEIYPDAVSIARANALLRRLCSPDEPYTKIASLAAFFRQRAKGMLIEGRAPSVQGHAMQVFPRVAMDTAKWNALLCEGFLLSPDGVVYFCSEHDRRTVARLADTLRKMSADGRGNGSGGNSG
jgi:hypothetical protein